MASSDCVRFPHVSSYTYLTITFFRKPFCLVFNSANSTDPVSDSNSAVDTLVENILGVQTAGSTNDVKACKVFRVSDPKFTIAMDDNRLIIEKEGRAVSLLGQLYGQLPIAQSGSSTGNTFDATIDPDTANDTTQTQPSAGPSTSGSPSSDPSSGGLQPSSSTSTFTPSTPDIPYRSVFVRTCNFLLL